MENVKNVDVTNEKDYFGTLTANEVKNVTGVNYKQIVKMLDTMATKGEIEVTEKIVQGRSFKAYILRVSDVSKIREKIDSKKDFLKMENAENVRKLANGVTVPFSEIKEQEKENAENVKFYEVIQENFNLKNEVLNLKTDIQKEINERVKANADLTVARTELKFIEDKQRTFEAENSKLNQVIDRKERELKIRNIIIGLLSAVLLVVFAVGITLFFARAI